MVQAPNEKHSGTLLHGTAVAIGSRAVLIRGPSGCGKSDLALRCLFMPTSEIQKYEIRLVADDYVTVERSKNCLLVCAPQTIQGKIEVRGLGIFTVPWQGNAELVMMADLVTPGEIERLPDHWPHEDCCGVSLPVVKLAPFEASAAHKLLMALSFGIEEMGA